MGRPLRKLHHIHSVFSVRPDILEIRQDICNIHTTTRFAPVLAPSA
jgi:hypothetical protein